MDCSVTIIAVTVFEVQATVEAVAMAATPCLSPTCSWNRSWLRKPCEKTTNICVRNAHGWTRHSDPFSTSFYPRYWCCNWKGLRRPPTSPHSCQKSMTSFPHRLPWTVSALNACLPTCPLSLRGRPLRLPRSITTDFLLWSCTLEPHWPRVIILLT